MESAVKPAVIYLLRHGQTEHNASGRLMGHLDISLNEVGLLQAETAARLLASRDIRAVYSSDLQRAYRTAERAAKQLGLRVIPRPALREVDVGSWEGMTDAELRRADPEGYAAMAADPYGTRRPGGESYAEMADRVWGELESIAAAHPGEEVLAVSHGGPMRSIICRVLALPWERRNLLTFQNCGLLALICDSGAYRLEVPGWAVAPGF